MRAVHEDEGEADDDGEQVRHEVEAGEDPGRGFEPGDDEDGDGEGGDHPDRGGAPGEEAGGRGARQELELHKLGGVASVGGGEQEE